MNSTLKKIMLNNCFLILMAILVFSGCISDNDDANVVEFVNVGDKLPEFDVEFFDGGVFYSTGLHNKKSLIAFFVSTCSDCRKVMPELEKTWELLKDESDCEFLAIARGEEADEIADYVRQFTMPIFIDPYKIAYSKFATLTVPRIYVADKSGIVTWMAVNKLDISYEKLAKIVKEQ